MADTFEKTVATVVETKLGTAHPDLRGEARRGFQLLDRDEEERKAFGVYRLQLNAVKALIPIVYHKGEVDGFDILVLVPTGLYVPAVDSWINMLMGSGTPDIEDFLPEEIKAPGPSNTHLPFHDFPYAMRTAEACGNLSKDEVETVRHILQVRKAETQNKTSRLALYREFILSHPSAAKAVLRSAATDEKLEAALTNLYGDEFFDYVKTVSEDAPVENDLLAHRAETAPERPGLFVVDGMAHPVAADLPESAKKLLVKTGQFIVDRRAASETTLVFNSPFGSYQSGPPPGNSGLVLVSGVGAVPCRLYKYNTVLGDLGIGSVVGPGSALPEYNDRPRENPSTRVMDGSAIPGTRLYKSKNRMLVISADGQYIFDAPTTEIYHVPAANAPVVKGRPQPVKIKGGEKLGEIDLAARIRDRDREIKEKQSKDGVTTSMDGGEKVECQVLLLFPNHTCAELHISADREGGELLYCGDNLTVTVRDFRNPQKTGNTVALPADTVVLLPGSDRIYGGVDRKGKPGTPQELRRQLVDQAKFEELAIKRKATSFDITGAVTRYSATRNDAHRALVFDASVHAPTASRMLSELKAGATESYLIRRPDNGKDMLDTGVVSHSAMVKRQAEATRKALLQQLTDDEKLEYTRALEGIVRHMAAEKTEEGEEYAEKHPVKWMLKMPLRALGNAGEKVSALGNAGEEDEFGFMRQMLQEAEKQQETIDSLHPGDLDDEEALRILREEAGWDKLPEDFRKKFMDLQTTGGGAEVESDEGLDAAALVRVRTPRDVIWMNRIRRKLNPRTADWITVGEAEEDPLEPTTEISYDPASGEFLQHASGMSVDSDVYRRKPNFDSLVSAIKRHDEPEARPERRGLKDKLALMAGHSGSGLSARTAEAAKRPERPGYPAEGLVDPNAVPPKAGYPAEGPVDPNAVPPKPGYPAEGPVDPNAVPPKPGSLAADMQKAPRPKHPRLPTDGLDPEVFNRMTIEQQHQAMRRGRRDIFGNIFGKQSEEQGRLFRRIEAEERAQNPEKYPQRETFEQERPEPPPEPPSSIIRDPNDPQRRKPLKPGARVTDSGSGLSARTAEAVKRPGVLGQRYRHLEEVKRPERPGYPAEGPVDPHAVPPKAGYPAEGPVDPNAVPPKPGYPAEGPVDPNAVPPKPGSLAADMQKAPRPKHPRMPTDGLDPEVFNRMDLGQQKQALWGGGLDIFGKQSEEQGRLFRHLEAGERAMNPEKYPQRETFEQERPEPPPEPPSSIMRYPDDPQRRKPLKPGARVTDSGFGLPDRTAEVADMVNHVAESIQDEEGDGTHDKAALSAKVLRTLALNIRAAGTPENTLVSRSALLLQDSPEQIKRVTGQRMMQHPNLSMGVTVQLTGEQKQDRDVIDSDFLEQLVRATDFREITESDVQGLIKAMHQAGRLLLVFLRNRDKAEQKYGKEDAERLMDQLRQLFIDNGDAAIFLREKRGVDGTTMDEKMLDLLSVDMG